MAGYRMSSYFEPVFFDLETTGFNDSEQIIQIAATDKSMLNVFCRYMLPTKNIPRKVSKLTGFTKFYNILSHHGEIKETTSLGDALEDFLGYLRRFNRPVILIAHNCFSFDCRFLIKVFKLCGLLDELSNVVQGFCDSLPLLKRSLPYRKSYSLESLVRDLINPYFTGHDAVGDSRGLASIFEREEIPLDEILELSSTFAETVHSEQNRLAAKRNYETLVPLQYYLTIGMLKRIATAGLDMDSLKRNLNEKGPVGLKLLLSENLGDGRPRVTRNNRILNNVCHGVQQALYASYVQNASYVPHNRRHYM